VDGARELDDVYLVRPAKMTSPSTLSLDQREGRIGFDTSPHRVLKQMYMKSLRVAAMALLSWTMFIYQPGTQTPEVKTGFPTKAACEQAAAKWRADFETKLKEGTIRTTNNDRRRRLARAVPSIKCAEGKETPPSSKGH
jgi:hypothetical protein